MMFLLVVVEGNCDLPQVVLRPDPVRRIPNLSGEGQEQKPQAAATQRQSNSPSSQFGAGERPLTALDRTAARNAKRQGHQKTKRYAEQKQIEVDG
jgi:hypothetical protein